MVAVEVEGWRYASASELQAMLMGQGIVGSSNCGYENTFLCGYDSANNGKVAPIIQLLGVLQTHIFPMGETRFGSWGWLGTDSFDGFGTVNGKIISRLQDFEDGQPRFHDALNDVTPGLFLSNLNEYQTYLGSWLVRESAPIPEPSTALLLGLGITGIAARQRQHRRGTTTRRN